MSFSPFADTGFFLILETDSESKGGSFNLAESTDLANIQTTIIVRGTLSAGSERARLRLYGNSSCAGTPISSSSWFDFSSIGSYTNNWIGNVFFDFENTPINPSLDYYITVETDNYTKVPDTFYIGVRLDWGPSVNSGSASAIRMTILGRRVE